MGSMKSMSLNDSGKKFLVENCQKIDIRTLLKACRESLKNNILNSEIETKGVHISLMSSKTGFGGTRVWFKCPSCGNRVGTLFVHPVGSKIGCRACLSLEYRS